MVWLYFVKVEILLNILYKYDGVFYFDFRVGILGVNILEVFWDGCGYKFSYD